MPSAPLLVLSGDIPGLVAVTPASAAAAKFAYAMTADLGTVGGIRSAAYAINDNGERLAGATGPGRSEWSRNQTRKTTRWMRKATWRWRYRLAVRRIRRSISRYGLAMAPPRRPKPCPS